ncbi:FAD-binding protein [Pelagibacteraceae bacterium]|nr:FAD-binding protein [Pelagibacteraceae bacterium]
MEEKQNSQTFLDFNQSVFKPSTREEISKIIKDCYKKNIPLEINGLKSKKNIGRNFQAEKSIDLSNYSGIIDYKPEELYIKVKSGTPIKDIVLELDKNNQQLAFEPTDFGPLFFGKKNEGSIGGVISCNFAGPRRFKVGSARDHVLGFQGVNGKGEIIKSGGTVVKNVTGYDLSKILTGSFGTLSVLTEVSVKVLPKPPSNKTIVINNPDLKKSLEYLSISLSSSSDPSGGVFYPDYFRKNFMLNDLTNEGPITAIRIEGDTNSIDHRIKKLCKEMNININDIVILEHEQTNIFWEKTCSLRVFSELKNNLLRIVIPASETFELLNKLNSYKIKYFIDWGGSLIWLQIDVVNQKILREMKEIVSKASGYLTVIKIEENLKASIDVFTIDPIKYKISEKIKKSFDPKRILNPGKMYPGI